MWVMLDKKLGQILLKPCVHPGGHSFASIFIKLCLNVWLDNILAKFEYGLCQIKN